ncbi:MAG: glycosyltransferase [Gloeotrichia echinulata DVL01]|jgi:SAM-dependent methyltransferase|nr:glycosyltransferase [Gloeotrichia echinulata DEX184]
MYNHLVKEKTKRNFDEIALDLDWWNLRNKYYYQDIQNLHKFLIPTESNVLEIGCGTGDLLASLNPKLGVGIDLSPQVITIAEEKYPSLSFYCLDAENINQEFIKNSSLSSVKFDFIILSGVLGYLTDIQLVLQHLQIFCHPRTRIILTFHNFLWEPILRFAERIHQRRPQPPQNWLSMNDIINLLSITGYQSVKIGRRFLIPKRIPVISDLINRYFSQLPVINHLGLTNYVVARPAWYGNSEKVQDYTVSVIIPARNEAGNIPAAIERLPQLGKQTEVIFVEGHSKDDTWEQIQQLVQNYQGNFTLKAFQQTNKGKADAVRLGFNEATGDILIILDADLTVQPEELIKFVEVIATNRGEFINGSRLVYPYSNQAMPWLNSVANKFFALIFSFLLGQNIKDTLCGTKVLWREDYQRIANNRNYFGDFDPFGDFDLLFGAAKLNLHLVEVPVRYQERTYGKSNISHFREGLVLLGMCLHAARKIKFIL